MDSNQLVNSFNWTAKRGDKWREQLGPMEAMLAPLDNVLLASLRLDAPMRVADVGCGGGGTTLEIARIAPAGSSVVGVDVSTALIEAARQRVSRAENVATFTTADVAKAPPPGGPFERLVSRFGLMFFENPVAAFENLATWLAPKGRFVFVVWGLPAENPCFGTARRVIAEHVALPAQEPGAPGPFRYGEVKDLLRLLAHAGFGCIEVSTWRGELALGGGLSASDASDFVLATFAMAQAVEEANEVTRDNVRRALTERFSQHLHCGLVRLGACAHFVAGTRLGKLDSPGQQKCAHSKQQIR